MPTPIEKALQVTIKAKEDVLTALAGEELTTNAIFITTKLTEIINRLSFQLGVSAGTIQIPQNFPPVTNFLGEEIKRTPEVSEADLTPNKTEQDLYLEKVTALASTFRDRQPETLITDFSNEPLVLRGVAKRAGLEDYEEGLINIDFIERIKAGLDAIDTRAKEEDAINQELGFDGLTAGNYDNDVQDVPGQISEDNAPIAETDATDAPIAPKTAAKKATKR